MSLLITIGDIFYSDPTTCEQGNYYSVNEAYQKSFPDPYNRFISRLQSGEFENTDYSSRHIGSLVADFHRTLLRGGIFMYPPPKLTPRES